MSPAPSKDVTVCRASVRKRRLGLPLVASSVCLVIDVRGPWATPDSMGKHDAESTGQLKASSVSRQNLAVSLGLVFGNLVRTPGSDYTNSTANWEIVLRRVGDR